MSITDSVRQVIRERAGFVCEYCHSSERLSASRFTMDHILPVSIGGSDDLNNLALACRRCNERRYNFVAGFDPESQKVVPVFNPREQEWSEHFIWTFAGTVVKGLTPIGRATCNRFDLNDMRYPEEDSIRSTRQIWAQTGLHPPSSDPIEE
jgi:hypothetical protein